MAELVADEWFAAAAAAAAAVGWEWSSAARPGWKSALVCTTRWWSQIRHVVLLHVSMHGYILTRM